MTEMQLRSLKEIPIGTIRPGDEYIEFWDGKEWLKTTYKSSQRAREVFCGKESIEGASNGN